MSLVFGRANYVLYPESQGWGRDYEPVRESIRWCIMNIGERNNFYPVGYLKSVNPWASPYDAPIIPSSDVQNNGTNDVIW
jgi:hypothetical protein